MRKRLRARVLAAAAGILLAALVPAIAGETVVVHRKDGSRVEGEIVRDDPAFPFIEIRTKFGVIRIQRTDLDRISKGLSLESRFRKRRAAIRDSDAASLMKLARWCEENNLRREALGVYGDVAKIASEHYLDACFRFSEMAMELGEYRRAVERYVNLATRQRNEKAWQALKRAEDKLRRERETIWKKAETEREAGRYQRAILGYSEALHLTIDENPAFQEDIGRAQVRKAILDARRALFEEQGDHLEKGHLLQTNRGGIGWHYSPLPKNLRGHCWLVPIADLRLETERYEARWLAVKGTFRGFSRWDDPGVARALKLDESGHQEIAVAAYLPAAKAEHERILASRARGDVYLEELIEHYPYEDIEAQTKLLSPGRETVCYGRLRKRDTYLPEYVFEIWEMQAVGDPDAIKLAEYLKTPLLCEFQDAPLDAVLAHIQMLSQVNVAFENDKRPDMPITLKLNGQPTGYAIHRIAKELGLEWTRRGTGILMKKTLSPEEKLLQEQVRSLATDTNGK